LAIDISKLGVALDDELAEHGVDAWLSDVSDEAVTTRPFRNVLARKTVERSRCVCLLI